jgi:peptidoglycan hydrolase CwlO-like protein
VEALKKQVKNLLADKQYVEQDLTTSQCQISSVTEKLNAQQDRIEQLESQNTQLGQQITTLTNLKKEL